MACLRSKVAAHGVGTVLSLVISHVHPAHAQTVDSCPNASWKDLIFLKMGESHSPNYFANMTSWSSSQYKDWLMSQTSHFHANLAFLIMVLISLLAFITWRLVICCCHGCYCCGSKQNNVKPGDPCNGDAAGYAPHQPPEQQLKLSKGEVLSNGTDKHTLKGRVVSCYEAHNSNMTMAWLKPIILLMAVAAIMLVIIGMAGTHKDLASRGWQQLNKTEGLVDQITLKADVMLDTAAQLSMVVGNVTTILSVQVQLSANSSSIQAALTAMDSLRLQLDSTVSTYQSKVADIHSKVVTQINKLQTGSTHDTVNMADGWRYKAMELIYGVGLLFLLCVIIAMAVNLPALLTLSVLFLHIIMILWFLIALIAAVVLTVGHELCPATEVIAISVAGSQYSPILQYYFYDQGSNVTMVLQQAGIVDISVLDTQMDSLEVQVNAQIQLLQQQFNLTADLTAQLNQIPVIMANMKTAESDLIAAAGYDQVNPVYASVKGYFCCTVMGELGKAWQCLTGAAWVTLVMVWLTNCLITQYDRAPGSGKRCGWTMMHPFPPPTHQIHPVDGGPVVVQMSPYPPEVLPPGGPYIGAYFPPAQMQQAVPWAELPDQGQAPPGMQEGPVHGAAASHGADGYSRTSSSRQAGGQQSSYPRTSSSKQQVGDHQGYSRTSSSQKIRDQQEYPRTSRSKQQHEQLLPGQAGEGAGHTGSGEHQ